MTEKNLVMARPAARAAAMGTGSLYRMAREGLVPFYRIGPKGKGIRFCLPELLAALRRPVVASEPVASEQPSSEQDPTAPPSVSSVTGSAGTKGA